MFAAIVAFLLLFLISIWFIFRRQKKSTNNGQKVPPGPKSLPIIGNLHQLSTIPHCALHQLSQKYGPIMLIWLGQVPTIVVSSPKASELFLKTHDTNFASRAKIQASEYISYGSKGLVFSEYGPYWRTMRKICTLQLLSSSKIESFLPLRKEELDKLVEWLKKDGQNQKVVNISQKVFELTEEITYRMVWGRSHKEDESDLKGLIKEVLRLAGTFNLADYVPYVGGLDLQGLSKRMKKVSKTIDRVLEKIILEHEQATTSQQEGHDRDFVDVLLSLKDQPLNPQDEYVYIMDRTNIKAILLDMFIGAFDTSATAIEWTFSELLRHPRVITHLQKELKTVIGMDQMVEEKHLGKLPYLDMVIKESLRLHPVASFIMHESIEDITIEGYYIRKNSRVIVNTWSIGHDPNVWSENVEEFCPERFIDSNIDLRGHDFQLIPFGSGRRGCPGMQLGLTTVKIVIAQLVHCFNWELPIGMQPSDIDMTEVAGITVSRAKPLLVRPPNHCLLKHI